MSEQAFTLLSWKGEVQGNHSAGEIKKMWEAEEISGLFQVVTDTGNMSVQEFLSFEQEQSGKELIHQQQLAQAQADIERQRLENERVEAETAQKLELERERNEREREQREQADAQASGKIYYLYLGGQKKGPYSKENLQVMYQGGKVDESTPVWTQDLGEWVDLKGFKEITGNPTPGPLPPQFPQHPMRPLMNPPQRTYDPPSANQTISVNSGGSGAGDFIGGIIVLVILAVGAYFAYEYFYENPGDKIINVKRMNVKDIAIDLVWRGGDGSRAIDKTSVKVSNYEWKLGKTKESYYARKGENTWIFTDDAEGFEAVRDWLD